jgi:transposase
MRLPPELRRQLLDAIYAAIGVDLEGQKDILGMWFGDGGGEESAKFWMVVLTELRNRGVADVFSVGVVARAWLMAKEFRPVRRDQVFLMPPDMREWLPSDHLVWFILDTLEALDLTGLEATRRRGGVGAAGYDPRMLLGLLMYGYCRGVRSSRQIERLCGTDVAFRVLCAQDVPDHCTLARFRADCQDGFTSLFTQV